MRIGVDVGGTNTDAVLMHGKSVLATHKALTSDNISDGIIAAVEQVLHRSRVAAQDITHVMIGTTQFTNAFVQQRGLLDVALVRIAMPAARGIPPLCNWPAHLLERWGKHVYQVKGGYQYDGRLNEPLDEAGLYDIARDLKQKGLRSIAVTGLFSPVNSEMEERAREIFADTMPDAKVSLSYKIGRLGLLERESATLINASLLELAEQVIGALHAALSKLNIRCKVYISQNDGTMMNADYVERYPVLTFASGSTNSMRGAAYLTGIQNALVADIGGTTTDIGMLVNGFPRESSVAAEIGGIPTNFRMPDILSIGLGGGSVVQTQPLRIGPESVGHQLSSKAQCFGGNVLTASDLVVAAGKAQFGDASRLAHLPAEMIEQGITLMQQKLSLAIDRVKTNSTTQPLILVGGGAALIQQKVQGVSETVVPDNANVANAIGACIAKVGGEVDKVYSYDQLGRDTALDLARQEAINAAIKAGGAPDSVEVTDIEELPLQYVPGGSVRVRVKAAGDLVAMQQEEQV